MMMLATLPSPLPPLNTSDQVSVDGVGVLRIIRGGVILFTVDLRPLSVPLVGFRFGSSISSNQVVWERRAMAAQSFALTAVIHNQETGLVRFRFDDGSEETRTDWALCQEDVDAVQSEAIAKKALIAKSYIKDPTGANMTLMVGGACTINLQADDEFAITEPA